MIQTLIREWRMTRTSVLIPLLVIGLYLYAGETAAVGLEKNYYRRSCPQAEFIVRRITWENVAANPTLPAKFVRLLNHDCFVRGCDASILLDQFGNSSQTEKQVEPNLSLGGYEVIDLIKEELERACPLTVSCADIIALAARDSVSFQFGRPLWEVSTGRRDGSVSLASEVPPNFPKPTWNFTQLKYLFARKGLDVVDLVALTGAHTLGVSHCTFFAQRLNFTGKGDTDPSLDPGYADYLRTICRNPFNPAATAELDLRSSRSFDTNFFTRLLRNRVLLQSDAALLTNPEAAAMVRDFQDPYKFISQFAVSMEKMGAFEVLTGSDGEIRRYCRSVNV